MSTMSREQEKEHAYLAALSAEENDEGEVKSNYGMQPTGFGRGGYRKSLCRNQFPTWRISCLLAFGSFLLS
jgi:hypothetical protein